MWDYLKTSVYVTAPGLSSQTDEYCSHALFSPFFLSNGFRPRRCSVYQAHICTQAFTTCAAAPKLPFQIPSARADICVSSLTPQKVLIPIHVPLPVSPPLKTTKWHHQHIMLLSSFCPKQYYSGNMFVPFFVHLWNLQNDSIRQDAFLQLLFQTNSPTRDVCFLLSPPLKTTKRRTQGPCLSSLKTYNSDFIKTTSTKHPSICLSASGSYKARTTRTMPILSQRPHEIRLWLLCTPLKIFNFNFMNTAWIKRPFTCLSASGVFKTRASPLMLLST